MFRFNKGFNWENSEAHLLLLSKFIHGQEIDYFVKWGNWEQLLNEAPQKAIKQMIHYFEAEIKPKKLNNKDYFQV